MRGCLQYRDRGALKEHIERLGGHHNGTFNCIEHHCFADPEYAQAFAAFVDRHMPHPLLPNADQRPTNEEVEAAWAAIERERSVIMRWARAKTGRLQKVVQEYRFERRQGSCSWSAHQAAAKIVTEEDPGVADPMNYAGVLIEWAEREHRGWFWRCCRDHHVL